MRRSLFILLITLLLFWDRRLRANQPVTGEPPAPGRIRRASLLAWAAATIGPVVLIVALLLGGPGVSGNRPPGAAGWSVIDLYAAHVYEHSLDYLFYLLAGSAVILLAASVRGRRR